MTTKNTINKSSRNTALTLTLEQLSSKVSTSLESEKRILIAIAGPPGSGKSTSSERLKKLLKQEYRIQSQIIPMDGYHYDNNILQDLKLLHKKGSPETFDINGFEKTLGQLSQNYQIEDTAIPVFDRKLDLSRGSARLIKQDTQVLLCEGNYLLLDDEKWSGLHQYFNITVMIECEESELRKRLIKRWLNHHYSEAESIKKAESNDLPNARKVMSHSVQAHYIVLNDLT